VVDVHFVLPQLTPYYGMEKAATLLMTGLQRDGVDVSATVLSGEVPAAAAALPITKLGLPRRLTRLAEAVPALRRRLGTLPLGSRVVASGLWAAAPVGLALMGTGRSYVSWEHTVLPARLMLDRRVSALFRVMWARYTRPATVIAVSDGVRRAVAHRAGAGTDVVVIPNMVDTPSRAPGPRSAVRGTVSLITTGALRGHKNYSCALQALRHLPPEYRLTMAGDGPQLPALRSLAADLGLADRVAFLGHVDDLRPHLQSSHALVHPSLFETFGFSLIEAADHGLPVATLRVASIDELVPTYVPGAMAEAPTPVALADAVRVAVRGIPGDDIRRAWELRRRKFSTAAICAQWREALDVRGRANAV
jgi:glycosyltransferase involved in cell wall biosynthesis